MINGQIYDKDSQWHPNLDFVGRIDPLRSGKALGTVFLVSPTHVITAEHCLKETHEWNLAFADGTERTIADFESVKYQDIAYCKLDKPIDHLPYLPVLPVQPSHRQYAIFTGWGKTRSDEDPDALRWGATRLVRLANNYNIQVERGRRAPHSARGDSGAPIVVLHEGGLYAAVLTRQANLFQKGLWHFHDRFECSPGLEMSDELFESMVKLDYERRPYREIFTSRSIEDWRNLDDWLAQKIASENK